MDARTEENAAKIKFIHDVIEEAKKTFVSGNKIKRQPEYPASKIKDKDFIRDTNLIQDTPFIIAGSPRENAMRNFFHDTVYNKKYPLDYVICFEDILVKSDDGSPFFPDYFCHPGERYYFHHVDGEAVERLKVTNNNKGILVDKQIFNSVERYEIDMMFEAEILISQSFRNPDGSWSEFSNPKKLTIRCIPIGREKTLAIDNDNIESFSHIYQTILKAAAAGKYIFLHAGTGNGRAGHYIFAVELLRNYKKVFENKSIKDAAIEVHNILNRIRATRPALITTTNEFIHSILAAATFYDYESRKKLSQSTPLQKLNIHRQQKTEEKDEKELPAVLNLSLPGGHNRAFTA